MCSEPWPMLRGCHHFRGRITAGMRTDIPHDRARHKETSGGRRSGTTQTAANAAAGLPSRTSDRTRVRRNTQEKLTPTCACSRDGIPSDAPVDPDSLVCDMSTWRSPGGAGWGANSRLAAVPAAHRGGVGLGGLAPARPISRTASISRVYRMGGRAWLDGRPFVCRRCDVPHPVPALTCRSPTRPLAASRVLAVSRGLPLNAASVAITADHPGAAQSCRQ